MMTRNSQKHHPNQFLRQAREQRGWSQERLAQELEVSPQTVSRWECGTTFPYPRYREHLCRLFEKNAPALGLAQEKGDEGSGGIFTRPSSRTILGAPAAQHLLLSDQMASTSPLWSVPYRRNAFFTGREQILQALPAQLGAKQAMATTQPAALHGLGGIGKTQIALEYAYRHALDYHAIFWMGAETEEQLVASLLRVAWVLGLPEREDQDQHRVVTAVQRWLSTHDHWLLIWDNVEDLELLTRYLPVTGSGAVLITTHCRVLGTLARGIDLVPMEAEEGVLFLLRRAKILPPEATHEHMQQWALRVPAEPAVAAALVTELAGLPLALDQAGAYLEETCCGLSAYLERFCTQRAALLKLRGDGPHDHPASVSTTFTLAMTKLVHRDPTAGDLLRVCALLHPDAIPEELFRGAAEYLGARLQAVCGNALEWDRIIAITCSSSLLSRQPEEHTLSLHRLVQAVLLDTMTRTEREQWNERVCEALNTAFPEVRLVTVSASWKQAERLFPHALLCVRRMGTEEESFPLASLVYKVGLYLSQRGEYIQAEPLLQRALAIREHLLGPDHPDVTYSLNGLAVVYWNQGKYTQAEPLYQRILSILSQSLPPDHPEMARPLNNLAILYWKQGIYAQAEVFAQRALQIWEQSDGPDQLKVANALNNLAGLHYEQGRYLQAEPLIQRALAIREHTLGSDHPLVAFSAHNLAEVYQEQGKMTQAEALYWRAISLRERVLRPDHPDIAASLNSLAGLCLWQSNYQQAEMLYQRALSIQEQALGPDHPDVALTLNGLGTLRREQGKTDQAETLYQEALALREQQLGPHHPDTAQTLHDLAICHQKQGRLSEAVSLAERALLIRSQARGETHPQTITTRTLHAQLVQEQAAEPEQSVEYIRTFLKTRGWSLHLKTRRGKLYVYATRKVGQHTQSRYLAPLSNLAACLVAAGTLPNAKKEEKPPVAQQ